MENLIEELKKQIKINYLIANDYKKNAKQTKSSYMTTNYLAIYIAINETTKNIERIIKQYEQQHKNI